MTGAFGFAGLAFFLGMLCFIYFKCLEFIQIYSDKTYVQNFSRATIVSMLVYCAGGLFVSYAYYPWLYYLFAATVIVELILKEEKK